MSFKVTVESNPSYLLNVIEKSHTVHCYRGEKQWNRKLLMSWKCYGKVR